MQRAVAHIVVVSWLRQPRHSAAVAHKAMAPRLRKPGSTCAAASGQRVRSCKQAQLGAVAAQACPCLLAAAGQMWTKEEAGNAWPCRVCLLAQTRTEMDPVQNAVMCSSAGVKY